MKLRRFATTTGPRRLGVACPSCDEPVFVAGMDRSKRTHECPTCGRRFSTVGVWRSLAARDGRLADFLERHGL